MERVGLIKMNAGCDQTIMLHAVSCPMVNRGKGSKGAVISESEAMDLAEESGNKIKCCKCCK